MGVVCDLGSGDVGRGIFIPLENQLCGVEVGFFPPLLCVRGTLCDFFPPVFLFVTNGGAKGM